MKGAPLTKGAIMLKIRGIHGFKCSVANSLGTDVNSTRASPTRAQHMALTNR